MAPLSFLAEAKQVIYDRISIFSSRALIGRLVGYSRYRGSFRDWILAKINVLDGKVEDVLLLGKGTFMLLLSSEECSSSLLARSPPSLHDKLIFLVKWYPDFDMAAFEDRCQVPRFPMKLSFPGLPSEFRAPQIITQLGSIFDTPFESSIQLQASIPSIRVAVLPSMEFPDSIRFEWENIVRSQVLTVTGRPNQCLRCHTMGHLVKDCAKS